MQRTTTSYGFHKPVSFGFKLFGVFMFCLMALISHAQTYNFNQTFDTGWLFDVICTGQFTYPSSDLNIEVCEDRSDYPMPMGYTYSGYLLISGQGIGNSAGVDKTVTFTKTSGSNFDVTSITLVPSCYRPYSYSPYETTNLKVEAFQGTNVVGTYTVNGAQNGMSYIVNSGSITGTLTNISSLVVHTGVQDLKIDQLVISTGPSNTAPTASNVSIAGILQKGQTFTASYTYNDAENDAESGSTYSWYRSDDNAGTNKTLISGATGINYQLTSADAGKYISFKVTPNDGTTAGTAVESSLHGPVIDILAASISSQTNVACNGGADGSATVLATGGSSPYTYSWSPSGGNTATASGLAAGTYICTVTDYNGRDVQASVTITQPSVLMISGSSQTNVACNGGSDGAAAVAVSGGTSSYTYSWSPSGGSSATALGLEAGTYTCNITDANGCSTSKSFTITEPAPLNLSLLSQTNVTCNGDSTGSATVSVTGGTASYTYSWSPIGGTSATAAGLPAGTYTCTISDANGCSKTISAIITEPTALNVSIAVDNNVSCNGTSLGGLTVNVSGGVPGYSYQWSNGDSTASISDLSAGTYSVLVSDANGCSVNVNETVLAIADTISPILKLKDFTAFLGVNGQVTISGNDLDSASSDNCSIDHFNLSQSLFDCSDLGANEVTVQAIDPSGNVSSTSSSSQVLNFDEPFGTSSWNEDNHHWEFYGWDNIRSYYTYSGTGSWIAAPYSNSGLMAEADMNIQGIYVNVDDMMGMGTLVTLEGYDQADNLLYSKTVSSNYSYQYVVLNWNNVRKISLSWFDDPMFPISVFLDDMHYEMAGGSAATVTVVDTLKPIAIAKNINAYLNASGSVTIAAADLENGSSDNCSVDTLLLSKYNFTCTDTGANTVTLSAKDVSGNSNSTQAVVTVIDSIKPSVRVHNITAYLDAAGNATITANQIDNGTTDNCTLDTLILDTYNFSCADMGNNKVTLTAIDDHGNSRTDTASVMVLDTISPTVVPHDITVYLNSSGNASISTADVDSISNDNCSLDSLWLSKYNFSCADIGVDTVTFFVKDYSGNSASADFKVTVVDTVSPTVAPQNLTVYLNSSGNVSITASQIDNGSSDACGLDTLTLDHYHFNCTNVGNNPVVLNAEDNHGNSSQKTATVTVMDTISPVVNTQNITVYLDAAGQATINATYVDNLSSDACGIDTLILNNYHFDCSNIGANPITLTATDINGNTASSSALATVIDTVSPVVITKNVTAYLDVNGNVSITASQLDNGSSDACGLDTLILDQYSFNCANVGNNTVHFTATDVHGNSSSASVTVTVEDTVKPVVITKDQTIYLNANGVAAISSSDIDNGSYDACGIQSYGLSQYSFDCSKAGMNNVTLLVTDFHGNIDSATAIVTVLDTIAPVAITKNVTVYLDQTGIATVPASAVDNGSHDNCSYTLSLSQTSFDCTETGLNLKTFTITDANGNKESKDVLITVKDTISPKLYLHKSITLTLDQFGNASLSAAQLDSASTDNCSNLLFFSINKSSFNCGNLGDNLVTITAFDTKNNSTSGNAVVHVVDYLAPVVNTRNITAYLDVNGQVTVTPAAIDNASGDNCTLDSIWLDQSAFSCGDYGQNIVKLYARDQSGNTANGNAVVTILDTTKPQVQAHNLTAYLDASGAVSITPAQVDNGTSDNCSLSSLSLSRSSFNCADEGVNTVILTAVDVHGNTSSGTATIDVRDTISPVTSAKNITVYLDANGYATVAAADVDNGSTDACGIQNLSLNTNSFSCANVGIANPVQLTVTDVNGNTSTAMAMVNVVDTISPSVISKNSVVYLDASGAASLSVSDIDNGTTDNCSVQSLSLDKTIFSCAELGQNTVHLIATDINGNVSSAAATVTVMDTISPVVSVQNITVYLDANASASITPADVNNGSSDNCAIQNLSLSKSAFGCADVGTQNVVLTASDASGNITTGMATITIVDTISPVVQTQNITIALDPLGNAGITASDINNGSSDACGIQGMILDRASFSCADLGTNMVTLTVTDNHGNVNSKTATVTVIDNASPVMATQNITVYLNTSGNVNITPADVDNGSTDNCGITSYSLDISTFDCADLGQNLVVLSATDGSGNTAAKSAYVTVLDTINPTIDNLPSAITAYAQANQCTANVQWPAITGSDNCSVSLINTSKANGGVFPLGTTVVNVSATDGSGNSVTQSFDVIVVDTVAPMVSNVPVNYTVVPNANSCDAVVSWVEPVATDNCGGITWTKSHLPGATFPMGNTTVTYTATDADNNATTVSFVVSVSDQVAPTISNVPANITVNSDPGSCDAVVNFSLPQVTDNCSGANLTSSHMPGSVFPLGTTTVNFTATDGANNVSTASFTVTVRDMQKPTVTSVPANDTVGACGATYNYTAPTAIDNCSGVSVVQTSGLPSGSIFPAGVTVNTFRISDAHGNDTTVSFSIVVVPQGMPTLPNILEICEQMPARDLTLGQNIVWSGNGIVANGTAFDPASAGPGRHKLDYSFEDHMGCVAAGSIYITVLPQPLKPVINKIGSTTLTTGNYITYQWYRDGVAIPGATAQNYNYTQGGNYQVMVTNSSGCDNYSDGIAIGHIGGGIGLEEDLFGNLQLFPNPSQGEVTISMNRGTRETLEVSVFNTAGKKVYEVKGQTSHDGNLQLDLSNLPDATYVLYIKSGNYTAVKRVVLY